MTDHYYTNNPSTASDVSEWSYELKGRKFQFMTDNGVFSKQTVDFGSRLLIETANLADLLPGPLLDMGCGYGPIGLSMAKEAEERLVEMVDVNERALHLARQNAEKNGITNVNIHASDSYQNVERKDFAAVFTNPPIRAGKEVVHGILTGAYDCLAKGGKLVVVIQKKQGAPSAKAKMEETFGNAEVVTKDKGYWILESIKEDE